MFILLFVGALSQTPAQMGTYPTEQSCQAAIRQIYETRATPRGVVLTQQTQEFIKLAVDINLQYQKEFTCVKQA